MQKLKSLLLILLGQKTYLKLTSGIFFLYFKNGWLRNSPNYYAHYFVQNFIAKNNIVLDIGANLGYYSKHFAQLVGNGGKVYSVEPIELYRSVLMQNLSGLTNVTILPFALGEKDGVIKMGNPGKDKYRHGLVRVLKESEAQNQTNIYEVSMKNPATLFSNIGKIDYIKCDIEGYEVPVIPLMKPILENQQPIVQIETDGENKIIIHSLLTSLNYHLFYVKQNNLVPYPFSQATLYGDLIGIPNSKINDFKNLIIN